MSNRYERSKIEQSERAWKLFDPEGYAKAKEAEEKAKAAFLENISPVHPACPACGSRFVRVSDSMLHLVATARCLDCGHFDYV